MSGQESKADKIDRVQGNLPLPDDPPAKSDFNSKAPVGASSSSDAPSNREIGNSSNTALDDQQPTGSAVTEKGQAGDGADLGAAGLAKKAAGSNKT